jgi:hypothetical protein
MERGRPVTARAFTLVSPTRECPLVARHQLRVMVWPPVRAGLLIGVAGLIWCLSWFAGQVSLWTLAGSFIGLAGAVLLIATTGRESFKSPTAPVTVWVLTRRRVLSDTFGDDA